MTDQYNQQEINTAPPTNNIVNGEGAAVAEGNVLIPSATADFEGRLSTGAADLDVIGVVRSGGANGTTVTLASTGPFNVLVTGTITRGDFIATSATPGVAESTGTGGAPGDFAVAMESSADAGIKLIQCRWAKAEVF